MSIEGWAAVNFNWGENAHAGFWGCKTGVGNMESPSFVTRLSAKRNFKDVTIYGQTSSAYPSTNPNNRTTTRDITKGLFNGHLYMVGGNRLNLRQRFFPSVSTANPWRKSINGKGYNIKTRPF